MDITQLKAELPHLLPKSIKWAEDIEAQIIKQGIALNKAQQADAKTVGVHYQKTLFYKKRLQHWVY